MSDDGKSGEKPEDRTRFRPANPADEVAQSMVGGSSFSAPQFVPAGQERPGLIGAVLNGIFQIQAFISRGGMGEVYLAVNVRKPQDRVAVKVMLPHLASDPLVRERFESEADALLKLRHEALVQYRLAAYDPTLDLLYSVTEFIDGPSLDDVIAREPPPVQEVCFFLRRMALGLTHAHAQGIIHRDLKPANVLLPGGSLRGAKVIDFGIARHMDGEKETTAFGFMGTYSYAAPEQLGMFGGKTLPGSDVYSLGLVTLALAAGRESAMGATPAEAIERRSLLPDLSAVPAELHSLLTAMLQPNPADRIKDFPELLRRLDKSDTVMTPPDSGKAELAAVTKPNEPARKRRVEPRAAAMVNAGEKVLRALGVLGKYRVLVVGGGVVGTAVLIVVAAMALRPSTPPVATAVADPPLRPGTFEEYARVVHKSAPECTWLSVERSPKVADGLVILGPAGASGNAAEESKSQVDLRGALTAAFTDAKLAQPSVQLETHAVARGACAILDQLRSIRAEPNLDRAPMTFVPAPGGVSGDIIVSLRDPEFAFAWMAFGNTTPSDETLRKMGAGRFGTCTMPLARFVWGTLGNTTPYTEVDAGDSLVNSTTLAAPWTDYLLLDGPLEPGGNVAGQSDCAALIVAAVKAKWKATILSIHKPTVASL